MRWPRAAAARSVAGRPSRCRPMRPGGSASCRMVRQEARSLVRVGRIDRPEAVLLAPEQTFFLRENLKLKLLNARLALLSRQVETARSELAAVSAALNRYFDPASRRDPGRRHAGCSNCRRRSGPASRRASTKRWPRWPPRRPGARDDRTCAPHSGFSPCSASRPRWRCSPATTRARSRCSGRRGGSTCRSTWCCCCCWRPSCLLHVALRGAVGAVLAAAPGAPVAPAAKGARAARGAARRGRRNCWPAASPRPQGRAGRAGAGAHAGGARRRAAAGAAGARAGASAGGRERAGAAGPAGARCAPAAGAQRERGPRGALASPETREGVQLRAARWALETATRPPPWRGWRNCRRARSGARWPCACG